MPDRRENLRHLLRRAIQAQADMGLGELVVQDSGTLPRKPDEWAFRPLVQTISVSEAVAAEPGIRHEQGRIGLVESATYDSVISHNEAICNCQLCPLGQTRNKFVYGVGNPAADLMFVGEAPGADEDRLGEPFVGRAGKLLDKILAAMELSRNDIYIANILKCRPPSNRDPQPDEMEKCFPYLREQVRIIKPKLICALGRIATQAMLQTTTPLGKLRKQWHTFADVPMLATYHPAALLRFPQYKKDTWEDMQMLLGRYKGN